MTDYRRFHIPGATWFFTVNLRQRRGNHLLVDRIDWLREAFRYVNMSNSVNHSAWRRSLSCQITYIAFGRYRRKIRIILCDGVCLRLGFPMHYPLASESRKAVCGIGCLSHQLGAFRDFQYPEKRMSRMMHFVPQRILWACYR